MRLVSGLFVAAALLSLSSLSHGSSISFVGAQLYTSTSTGADNTSLYYGGAFQNSTNGSTNHEGLPLTHNGTKLGFVIAEPLIDGDNLFTFAPPDPAFNPGGYAGLNLFFNTTGVTYNPPYSGNPIPGDLTVFAPTDKSGIFHTPVAGTLIQSYETSGFAVDLASANGRSRLVLGDREITVTQFISDTAPAGSFVIHVAAVPEPSSLLCLPLMLSLAGRAWLANRGRKEIGKTHNA